jgi:DNA-binding CsgD family transcriptional regulator
MENSLQMKKAFLEQCLADGLSLEQIGKRVGRNPSTVSYHLKKHGPKPVNQGRHANKGPIPEEVLVALVERGLSLREMAAQLDRSPATIRHWFRKYGLKTSGMGLRRRELDVAKRAGQRYVESRCKRHGLTRFVLESRGYYRCMKCRQARVAQWRRRAKRRLIAAAGGKCVICGYDEFPGALQFHHLDPATKLFAIGHEASHARLRR